MPKATYFSQLAIAPGASDHLLGTQEHHGAANLVSAPDTAPTHNGEDEAFAGFWPTNFSKGLPHDAYGIVDTQAYFEFFEEIEEPTYTGNCGERVALFDMPAYSGSFRTKSKLDGAEFRWRAWESPTAGHRFMFEWPEMGPIGVAPAPRLGSDELAAEMAEVYALALLRDVSFEDIRAGGGRANKVCNALGRMNWFQTDGEPKDANGHDISAVSAARRTRDGGALTPQNLFRGSSSGCADGPYLSQFLLQGNDPIADGKARQDKARRIPSRAAKADGTPTTAKDGLIHFGPQRIDQRIEPLAAGVDYMRDWAEWLDVQNGANTKAEQVFVADDLKFIETPRDLAAYVHSGALYQTYLNACMLMLSWGTEVDTGLSRSAATGARGSAANWSDTLVMTLLSETASRALRAAQRHKFQLHKRARPEKLASVASLVANRHGSVLGTAEAMADAHLEKLENASCDGFSLLDAVAAVPAEMQFDHSACSQIGLPENDRNLLLPMAFSDGSPMHPSFGSSHATVAGACVTVLKAIFRTHAGDGTLVTLGDAGAPAAFVPAPGGHSLVEATRVGDELSSLTLNGELNKLAANVSAGGHAAGVHFYSDYFDSVRMGERIAVGLLSEQLSGYAERTKMSLETFDGDTLTIAGDGNGGATLHVEGSVPEAWWTRHLPAQARN